MAIVNRGAGKLGLITEPATCDFFKQNFLD
ncbi:MAG: hypothetical protein M2R45_03913 [Verrucomicrobia subdivision 3 bacterium]|nr:hypothetical protein [Limisphaerales bacterium]MCS1417506.1 hypothetical protein [Limisphaerales bacterium]